MLHRSIFLKDKSTVQKNSFHADMFMVQSLRLCVIKKIISTLALYLYVIKVET